MAYGPPFSEWQSRRLRQVASELNRRLPVRYVRMPSMDWQPESLGMCLRAGLAKSFA